ncbi:MAG TPA: DUF4936 family protein [Thiobacillaceae bacterium]|nr:DUF4936 family protein [Thiobacillaceae bacterium]HNU63736.1 DUF4936 family protein [Thiobacillaceae bacterium]
MHCYVWYRVERDDQDTETVVRAMMARLACSSGVAGQLLKKQGEPRLWMEVYVDVADPPGFQRLMEQKVGEFDLDMFLDGPRRVEVFHADGPSAPICARPT